MIRYFLLLVFLISFNQSSPAQNIESFVGLWHQKRERVYLKIEVDTLYESYVFLYAWKGRSNKKYRETIEVYRAFFKDGKLIMPASNEDHKCSYCEISISSDTLIYQCNEGFNFTNQFLIENKYMSTNIYRRKKIK